MKVITIITIISISILTIGIPQGFVHVTDSACPGGRVGFGCDSPTWYIQNLQMQLITEITIVLTILGIITCIGISIIKQRKVNASNITTENIQFSI